MRKSYEFFEHTADVGIIAYGETLEEAFENAALAMYDVMTDPSRIEARECEKIEVEAEDLEALLFEWLTALLARTDSKNLLFSKFSVRIDKSEGGYRLLGEACGERFDSRKHPSETEVKAVTYHMMEIGKRDDGGYFLKFILDI